MIHPSDSYTIKLDNFEGPFDLLLFFIERDELDIFDIPISKVTNEFLEHIRTLEELNLDVASEFILVAATLMKIKAKMLLPRPELDEFGEEIDPRQDLVNRLLEYKKFKEIVPELSNLEDHRSQKSLRGNKKKELRQIASKAFVDIELETLTIFAIMKSFDQALKKMKLRKSGPKHVVYKYHYDVEEQKDFIFSTLQSSKKVDFVTIFAGLRDRLHAIITFLALLELINSQEILIQVGLNTNNFWVTRRTHGA